LKRHLENEPVVARPPGNLYRFQKMVRRNKLPFAAGSAVAFSLILGLGVSTWMFLQERAARQEQVILRREAEAARNNEAEQRRQTQTNAESADLIFRMLYRAAENGDVSAQANVGIAYRHGRGVTRNAGEALKWTRVAADLGNATAQ